MDINSYLNRINYKGSIEPSQNTLKCLQKAHLLTIPFENLDIHSNTEIKLEPNHLFNKIIIHKRGGFCYELNGLFYSLLKELGFDVKMVSARVFSKARGYGPDRDHLALIVRIDGVDYLSDVGFGDFTLAPLKIELNTKQHDASGVFYIDMFEEQFRVNKIVEEVSVPNYIFTFKERELGDFVAMCHYQQYDPNSNFLKKKKITKATATGRVYLDEEKLSILENGVRNESTIFTKEGFDEALDKYFHIKE